MTETESNCSQTNYQLALQFEEKRQYKDAIQLYRALLNTDYPRQGDILFRLGWCKEQLGQSEIHAIKYYELALDNTDNPGMQVEIYFRLGWINLQQKKLEDAIDYFAALIRVAKEENIDNITFAHGVYWYAASIETQGQFIDAIKYFQEARNNLPELFIESCYRELVCLIHVGMYTDAIALSDQYQEYKPTTNQKERYMEILNLILQERNELKKCLEEDI